MRREDGSPASILLLSLHGYVAADPVLGKPDTGGQVTFVLELGKRLAERGHQVDIVTRRFEGQAAVDVAGAGLRVWRVPCGGPAFIRKEDMHEHIGEFVTNFLAATADAGLRYDLVNSHYWDAGWAGLRIAEALRIPHIHTPHSLGWWKQQGMGGAKPELEREFRFEERIRKEFLVYRRCDQLIATSPEQVEVLTARYDVPEERATMIPPGIDERRYAPVAGAVAGRRGSGGAGALGLWRARRLLYWPGRIQQGLRPPPPRPAAAACDGGRRPSAIGRRSRLAGRPPPR